MALLTVDTTVYVGLVPKETHVLRKEQYARREKQRDKYEYMIFIFYHDICFINIVFYSPAGSYGGSMYELLASSNETV
jgi:hypothetical protein